MMAIQTQAAATRRQATCYTAPLKEEAEKEQERQEKEDLLLEAQDFQAALVELQTAWLTVSQVRHAVKWNLSTTSFGPTLPRLVLVGTPQTAASTAAEVACSWIGHYLHSRPQPT